eukprot:TRINITY_DN3798_c1_g6_i1.p1 TRINITY_DN3798_c1_g6~~TRINITY_DN3798_c1_g6_i1.p1  ORF type:complete len:121 (+),score=12.40 TRINITY_DN3798_c1_g6_i1:58-420(+)
MAQVILGEELAQAEPGTVLAQVELGKAVAEQTKYQCLFWPKQSSAKGWLKQSPAQCWPKQRPSKVLPMKLSYIMVGSLRVDSATKRFDHHVKAYPEFQQNARNRNASNICNGHGVTSASS